ncbi:PREDICTED: transmembrane protein 132C, partial [Miniopterus natalensis]|uniref:transmembrane protein 132C n=1 Tax=Miniopterus natalensis TaxID=291302 RepID=UPI0007A6EB61
SDGAAPGPVAPLCGALSLVLGALLGKVIEGRGVADAIQRPSSVPPYLPVTFRVLRAETSFFLREAHPDPAHNSSLRSRVGHFFTRRAPRPPLLNATYGPFSAEKVVPPDPTLTSNSLGPAEKFGFDWRLKAHVLRDRIDAGRPAVQVLFHAVGRDWGSAVELYYTVHPGDGRGDCADGDPRKGNAIRPGRGGPEDSTSHLRRIGAVGLYRAQDSGDRLSELRLDGNVAIWLPSRPAKQGEVVTAYVTVASNSTLDLFILRAKVKKGVNVLSARSSEPRQWDVRQELGNGGKHTTSTLVCQRLAPSARNRSSGLLNEVAQVDLEIASFSSLSGTQPVTWQVEYPRKGASEAAVAEIFVSQKDLAGIVPLAMDTELLNTAILTGKTVALPIRVVSVEENGAVTDISESVECRSADEDVIKVSDRCDYVFVNGKEMKGKVDAVVNFTYQHLSAPLHLTVWVPRLPLQIEVSDTELSQIKGWRVPIVASRRPTRDSEGEEERRARGCALQYQHATVQVLTQFVSEGAGPWAQPSLLLGPDWQVDITHLVADSMKLEEPRVAELQDGRVLVGREVGMTAIQVLSPLSDSILAEKTVTVLEDKVSLTDLAVQLVAGLSVALHPSTGESKAVTAVATAEELLRAPKQEAVVSTWLQFSDGSATPLDVYDVKDFALTVTSLDEAVVSVPQARSPRWPVVAAEGEGQGPLVRVDLSISETCQKSKRKSVLAVGVGSVRVKFGQSDVDSGPAGYEDQGEIRNHASDRRPKGPDLERAGQDGHAQGSSAWEREEGALRRGGPTARSLLDNRVAKNSRLDGGRPPPEGQLGLSDLQIGMYALLGVFCLAILVFLINCATFALKYRHKQLPPEGQASGTHSHDWVWLGTEAELLESGGEGSPPPDEHTTIIDRGPGACEDSGHLLLNGGSQKLVQGQAPRPAEPGVRDQKREPLPSPTSRRKKVKFTTFTTIPPDDGRPMVNSILSGHEEDIKWVCPDLDVGTPQELRNYLEKFKDKP